MDTSKIIKGVVNSGRYTVTAPIVKEDYGLYLQIEGVELPSTYEVDFSNSEHNGTSVTMIGNSDGVLIPSQFISTGKDIFAFLYHVGADFGRTVYKFRIPNKCRPDRTDDTPTPEEQSTIDQAISALNTAVAQTAEDRENADASAQSAYESADEAQQARDNAQTYANNAQTSANNASASASQASASATASAQSASQSAQIKADVEDLVDDAQGYANASAQSASASANSASQAQGFAQSASASAQSASGYASNAQTSANTASNKASEASTSAQTATQKATESTQSASQALTYKTDAESAKTASQTAQWLAESARDSAQGYAEDAQGYAEDAQASAESISASASQIAQNTANILKAFPTDTASGAVASFSDGADNIPLKSLIVNIDPVQDTSSGDPSPENICPISGWAEANVAVTGANIWGGEKMADDMVAVASESDPSAVINGQDANGRYVRIPARNAIANKIVFDRFKDNERYTFILKVGKADTSEKVNIIIVYTDGTYTACSIPTTVVANTAYTYAVVSTAGKTVSAIKFSWQGGNTYLYYDESGVFEGVLTASDFQQFGRTIPISWQSEAGTVYGGSLDALTGKLTVYPYYASYNGETLTGEWISDRDVYAVGTTPTIGAQVVNIGAQGTEYQLTPQEVNSLLGANNIWADTGDTEVEYRADTTLYINRLTEPDADMIADSNIVSGQYFMVGNSLYLATANIASGAQIIVGTNCIRKSLSEALNEINA